MAERVLRCAVYTRKSTEDGLEQEFNSLDAQYEACAAYALSQKHEGWALAADRYDDGGFSGGNMNRPGFKRLLADVEAGRVDVILVYKVDRLTRSLADFAKIVEVLDEAKASFVSITQSFNTTTSMGRLTLNMLLSFGQFEREVTSERIRDKIAASKRKGMWMGGPVPLGYDVDNRRLVVNEDEAELIRHIMCRYLQVGSVVELADELNAQGHRTKVQRHVSGPQRGGCIFRRGTLYHLLSNPIYRGKIVHKGEVFEGEHEAIVPEPLWEAVRQTLATRASGPARRLKAAQPSLLAALVFDGEGRAMTPSHATKPSKRYRYYVTRPDLIDGSPAWRVSGHDLEHLVCATTSSLLADEHRLTGWLPSDLSAEQLQHALSAADLTAALLRSGTSHERASLLQSLVQRVNLSLDSINVALDVPAMLAHLGLPNELQPQPLVVSSPAVKVRRGHQLRLVIPGPQQPQPVQARRDQKLFALLAEAHAARKLVLANPNRSLASVGAQAGKCRTRLSRLLAIACLAPDIVQSIVEGRQPASLNAKALLAADLPLVWSDQRAMLGFS